MLMIPDGKEHFNPNALEDKGSHVLYNIGICDSRI